MITSMQQQHLMLLSNRIMLLLSLTSIKTQVSALGRLPSIKDRCFLAFHFESKLFENLVNK